MTEDAFCFGEKSREMMPIVQKINIKNDMKFMYAEWIEL